MAVISKPNPTPTQTVAVAATAPTTIAATYADWQFTVQNIGNGLVPCGAPTQTQPTLGLRITAVKYQVRADGNLEQSPLPGDTFSVLVADVVNDPTIGPAWAALVAALAQYGTSQGFL
jgi:hypothetical protein